MGLNRLLTKKKQLFSKISSAVRLQITSVGRRSDNVRIVGFESPPGHISIGVSMLFFLGVILFVFVFTVTWMWLFDRG